MIMNSTSVATQPLIAETPTTYHALQLPLMEVTHDGIQAVLGRLYLEHTQTNPRYLFLSHADFETLSIDQEQHKVARHSEERVRRGVHYLFTLNRTTGKKTYLVPVPAMEQGSVMVGFFE